MSTPLPAPQETSIFYPSSNNKPVAESYAHIYALLITLEVLRQYLEGRQATVLGNQFLYFSPNFPSLRLAPDVMVIFDVAPGGRDNYKTWEEGQVPAVIFEMTSEGTKDYDFFFKKKMYSQLRVQECWLFDPKGEWVEEKLRGYRLKGEEYSQITDSQSEPLQLRLQVEGQLIAFYRQDTGEKLLSPGELAQALAVAQERAQQAEERAQQAQLQIEQLKEQLRSLRGA